MVIEKMASPEIELKKVSLEFPQGPGGKTKTIYTDLDLTIEKGQFTVLLGPSGCGKSTLLNIINGLLPPTNAASLRVAGAEISDDNTLRSKMGYVFQNARLLPWKTLRQNVVLALRGLGVQPKEEWPELIDRYFRMMGLSDVVDHYPYQVSGGMAQRAAIIRAWANEPEILLMDEPFSHLDEITAAKLRREMINLWTAEDDRRTVVFVTHNISEAVELGSRVVVFGMAPKGIVYDKTIDLPWPRNNLSDDFIEVERALRIKFSEILNPDFAESI